MANPQLEDGYTRLANEIIDALMRTNLSAYQMRLLWAIWRETYGYQKKQDWISNSQLVEMTGLKKSHVSRTLSELKARNIVTRLGNKISFNKDYQAWTKLPIRVTVTNSGNKVTDWGNRSYQSGGTQKKKVIKKVSKVKNPPSIPPFLPNLPREQRPEQTLPYSEERSIFVSNQPDPYRLANYLFRRIVEHNPRARLLGYSHAQKEHTIEGWAKDIDLLLRKDLNHLNGDRSQAVGTVIEWATSHPFWSANILSGAKLREKWDTLTMQIKHHTESNSKGA
jgi:phage replication O-like protein O